MIGIRTLVIEFEEGVPRFGYAVKKQQKYEAVY
jgi:hypothetical protein